MSNNSNELEFNHTGHRELYNWWSDNPEKDKRDWPGCVNNGGDYFSESWCLLVIMQQITVKKKWTPQYTSMH